VAGNRTRARRRAELWAIYFMLLVLTEVPAFMSGWSAELGEHLGEDVATEEHAEPPPRHLRSVR
jgi:hypothetical protein